MSVRSEEVKKGEEEMVSVDEVIKELGGDENGQQRMDNQKMD